MRSRLLKSLSVPAFLLCIMWLSEITEFIFSLDLHSYGIYPRALWGLKGILFCPFIHGDFPHLISNSLPFFILGTGMLYFYPRVGLFSMLLITFFTGLLVWGLADIGGSRAYHIGASGLVYGFAGFITGSGIFRRNIASIALALLVVVVYGGIVWGVLPIRQGVSWESHLFGAISGFACAYFFRNIKEKDQEQKTSVLSPDAPRRPFLSPDSFERTRAQRLSDEESTNN